MITILVCSFKFIILILITNFIISIVDRNSDVTLSRPKHVRKKLSRTINKKKGDSKKRGHLRHCL